MFVCGQYLRIRVHAIYATEVIRTSAQFESVWEEIDHCIPNRVFVCGQYLQIKSHTIYVTEVSRTSANLKAYGRKSILAHLFVCLSVVSTYKL